MTTVTTSPSGNDDAMPPADEFRAFYEEHLAAVVRFVARRVDDAAGVEDVCAETWLAMHRGWSTFRVPRAVLFRVAERTAAAWRSKQSRDPPRPGQVIIELLDRAAGRVGDITLTVAQRIDLQRAFDRLTSRQREAVTYQWIDDLDQATVAELMGISVDGVKDLVKKARCTLRGTSHLAGYGREVPKEDTNETD